MQKKFLTALAACAVMTSSAWAASSVNVNGSTTVLPAMQKVAEAFMSEHKDIVVSISGSGSGNGIKALRDNMTDIAMSSRDLKSKEKTDFEKHGMQPKRTTVAHDAIVPVVNVKNPVKGLTMAQLRDIYAGKITNWKALGGADRPIVVVGRDSASGTFECWQELVMQKTRVTPRALLQSSNGGVVQAVAGNENAVGYIGIGYVDGKTHALTVDGKTASFESAKDRTWPISRDLYLFTTAEKPEARQLIDFMLSPKGQDEVKQAGFVPVK